MNVVTEHRVGLVAEIPVGEGRTYAVDGRQIAVFRLRDGQVRAVSATCAHAGGPLADGLIDGKVVICPLHGHTFELTTGCSTTGQSPVSTYPAHIDDAGNVVVSVPGDRR